MSVPVEMLRISNKILKAKNMRNLEDKLQYLISILPSKYCNPINLWQTIGVYQLHKGRLELDTVSDVLAKMAKKGKLRKA